MKFYKNGIFHVAIVDKSEITRIDFDSCFEPAQTIEDYYKTHNPKPTILVNGGFFNMTTREPVFNYMDEGKAKSANAKYRWGMGVVGDKDLIYGELGSRQWRDFVSGYPNLLDDSVAVKITFANEINYKARRTLIGYNDTQVMVVCVENPGINLIEAQTYMKTLGCKYAINLDGGGSTGMLINGVKQTSISYNRAVDNVVAIYTKEEKTVNPNNFLVPDRIISLTTPSGTKFRVNQKIIPNDYLAPKDIASYSPKGKPIKPCQLVNNGTGIARGITVHNTTMLQVSAKTTPAEQYCRATYNGNMGGAIVHYYVDDKSIWQMLETAHVKTERGWHAGDGSSRRAPHSGATWSSIGGNLDTIAIEVIGDSQTAEDNAAKLISYLVKEHDLNIATDIYTHNWFMGQPDDRIVSGTRKNCPVYIIPHWAQFLNKIKLYCGVGYSVSVTAGYKVGDKYTIKSNDIYTNGKAVPKSIVGKVFTIKKINNTNTAVLLTEINSWVKI